MNSILGAWPIVPKENRLPDNCPRGNCPRGKLPPPPPLPSSENCCANQFTGFYMMATLVFNELKLLIH